MANITVTGYDTNGKWLNATHCKEKIQDDFTISEDAFKRLNDCYPVESNTDTVIITDDEGRKLYRINGKWTFAVVVPAEDIIRNGLEKH